MIFVGGAGRHERSDRREAGRTSEFPAQFEQGWSGD
jgi:hypothetical protein